jgi:copper chaperone CopZ
VGVLILNVTGMTCSGCENSVKRALGRLDGVTEVTASHVDQKVVVTIDAARVGEAQVRERIAACGFTVAP